MAKLLQDISIGKNLQTIRKEKGMTQNEVCAKMDMLGRPMSQSTYAQIESGKRNIYISDLIVLKEIFAVDYEAFFQGLVPRNKYHQNA